MSNQILRIHACEDPKVYKNITQAAEQNGIEYARMYYAIKTAGEFIDWPYRYIKNSL